MSKMSITEALQINKNVTKSDSTFVHAKSPEVQDYALRLPKNFYKALKIYCGNKNISVNTFIYNTIKECVVNDPDFIEIFDFINC